MNACKCWAALLTAILLLPKVAASSDAAKEAYEKGKACLEKKDYDAAVTGFTEAIRLSPNNARSYNGRGLMYEKMGDKTKADADFTQAKKLGYKAP